MTDTDTAGPPSSVSDTTHQAAGESGAVESVAAAAPTGRRAARVNPNAVLAVVAVAQFMVVLDTTVVNVALPTIKIDLGFSEQSLSWVLNAYTLVFGGFLLLGGRAAGRPRPARARLA